MSIFDTLTNAVEKHPEVNDEQHSTLLKSAMEMFGNSGGLSGLVNNAESQGLGHIVGSWIGTGSNQPVSPDQVQRMVGQDRINQLAGSTGISSATAGAALASILPVLVDKLTPHGKLPQAA
jgi:uncharacterized protein YidB (DUF937 family)